MIAFIVKRVLSGVGLLLAISTIAYFLIFSSSTNIALNILGQDATDAQIFAKQKELGLDQPVFERYLHWLSHAIHGDFGVSWFNSEPVVSALLNRLPITLTIVTFAMTFAAIFAITLGTIAAIKGGWIDKSVQVMAIAGFAIPGFLLAIILVTFLAIRMKLLPATGWVAFADDPANWGKSLILPVTSLVLATVASAAQQIRSAIKGVMERDFVRTLTSRGIPRREICLLYTSDAADD